MSYNKDTKDTKDTSPPSYTNGGILPGWAILPLRLFLGGSFLLAGLDKLTDPTFLNASADTYIGNQIAGFAPGTPLEGFLTSVAAPNANLFGVMVMGGELCIGIAVLLGLLTRFAAALGLLINLTFFLSATWNVHPFYFGADLPYLAGWLTLVLAGPGPFALDWALRRWLLPVAQASRVGGRTTMQTPAADANLMSRRAFVGAGAAGLVGVALASTAVGYGLLHPEGSSAVASVPPTPPSPTPQPGRSTVAPTAITQPQAVATAVPTQAPIDAPTQAPVQAPTRAPISAPIETPTQEPTQAAVSNRTLIAAAGSVAVGHSKAFTLANGQPAILVHNSGGYSAYVAICTHQACTVHMNSAGVLLCPCHGSQFDPAAAGAVLQGPARKPLSAVAITVDPDDSVYLA